MISLGVFFIFGVVKVGGGGGGGGAERQKFAQNEKQQLHPSHVISQEHYII